MSWKDSVCQTSGAAAIASLDAYVLLSANVSSSAIDDFYQATEGILTTIDPGYFARHAPEIGSLLYVGLISATENYFRNILGFILGICPIARNKAAEEKVQLGSYLWGGADLHSRTAFDFIAFSSAKNVSDTLTKFIDHQIRNNGVWKSTLPEFNNLCELRHGVVHSGLVLSGKNALKLGLSRTNQRMTVSPSYATLQEAGVVCTTLVQAANNELFEALVMRWAVDWRRLPSWDRTMARKELKSIYLGFRSEKDIARGAVTNILKFETFERRLKKEFNL